MPACEHVKSASLSEDVWWIVMVIVGLLVIRELLNYALGTNQIYSKLEHIEQRLARLR